ncbi:MAG: ATP-binding protein, partial [Planctomycetes bacterium]|nr:ATP-binding protein [Planctomycetota bacterium]
PSGKVQGTGLGLSLAREFARIHGGEITVSSVLKVGTTFRVELPLEPVATTVSVSGASIDMTTSAGAVTSPVVMNDPATLAEDRVSQDDAEKLKARTAFADLEAPQMELADASTLASRAGGEAPLILIVEDNDEMRALLSNSLSDCYRVVTAVNGEEGLLEARRAQPDLIVSDVMMPRMNGTEMLKRIREGNQTSNIPVILVTARAGTESVVHGLETGATDYVTKPFHLSELQARIDAQLRAVRTRRQLDERETRLAALGGGVAQVAHDLRSPLTAVMLRTESLYMLIEDAQHKLTESGVDMGDLGASGNEDLSSIKRAVQRASGMIVELMDFVKGREVQIKRTTVPMLDFAEAVSREALQTLGAAEIELVLEVDPPEICVSMDRDRMMRVIENLLHNAREAIQDADVGRAGRIWLQVYTQDSRVVIRIADNGPGIAPELRQTLFQAYATAGKVDGTGLGLSIAANIVEAHGGTLRAEESPPEGGAAFCITLNRDQSFWDELVQTNAE